MPGSFKDQRERSNEKRKSKDRTEREMQWGSKVKGSSVLQNISKEMASPQKCCVNLFYSQVGRDKPSLQDPNKDTLVYSQAEGQYPPGMPWSMIVIIKASSEKQFPTWSQNWLPAKPKASTISSKRLLSKVAHERVMWLKWWSPSRGGVNWNVSVVMCSQATLKFQPFRTVKMCFLFLLCVRHRFLQLVMGDSTHHSHSVNWADGATPTLDVADCVVIKSCKLKRTPVSFTHDSPARTITCSHLTTREPGRAIPSCVWKGVDPSGSTYWPY